MMGTRKTGLKFYLHQEGWTQVALAAHLGVHESQVSLMVNGRRRVADNLREKLCKALKISESDLSDQEFYPKKAIN